MKPATYDCFRVNGESLQVTLQVPETSDEYDRAAGKEGSCVSAAVDHAVYHGTLGDVRYYFSEAVEAVLKSEFPNYVPASDNVGLTRKTKLSGKNSKGEEKYAYAEGEVDYVRRVLPVVAKLRGQEEVGISSFSPLLDKLMAETEEYGEPDPTTGKRAVRPKIRLDLTEAERAERQPKSLPKRFLMAGESIVKAGKAQKFADKWQMSITYPEGADQAKIDAVTSEAIGWQIKKLEDAEAAKTQLATKYDV